MRTVRRPATSAALAGLALVVVAQVRDELEQEYVDARRSQLDALVEQWVKDTE